MSAGHGKQPGKFGAEAVRLRIAALLVHSIIISIDLKILSGGGYVLVITKEPHVSAVLFRPQSGSGAICTNLRAILIISAGGSIPHAATILVKRTLSLLITASSASTVQPTSWALWGWRLFI